MGANVVPSPAVNPAVVHFAVGPVGSAAEEVLVGAVKQAGYQAEPEQTGPHV
jgi:hypothetical protein